MTIRMPMTDLPGTPTSNRATLNAPNQATLLRLLQLANSSFPTGAFNHSYGFETWVNDDVIKDAASAEALCRDWLRFSVATGDGAATVWAFRLMQSGDLDGLAELDEMIGALKLTREAREASTKTGQALLIALREVFALPNAALLAERICGGGFEGHQAIVYGAVAGDLGLDERQTASTFFWTAFSNLISVIARLVPLGQIATQRIIARSADLIERCTDIATSRPRDEISSSMTTLDLASMRHERLHTRLCMS